MKFVHLHVHSHYSLLDGFSKISDLIDKATKLEFPALALTDHGNMYGAIEFYKKAKEKGIKPIIGVEAYLAPQSRFDKTKSSRNYYHLTLLAQNEKGYQNLMKLVTKAWLEGFYYKPRIDKELLREYHEGIIALSGCLQGEIPQLLLKGYFDLAKEKVKEYLDIFGKDNFYLEVNFHPKIEDSIKLKKLLIKLHEETKVPLVASYDSHYVEPEHSHIHDVFLSIQTGKDIQEEDRLSMKNDDFSLADTKKMKELFEDFPQALEMTYEIAEKCNLEIELGKIRLPKFPLPYGETKNGYLRKLVEKGISKRNLNYQEVKDRLEYELKVIEETNFASYFLIVADIVNWAKENKIIVGPARGSVGGSLVSYLLGITEINPLRYNLLFERFLNPQRKELPDIDIDFSDTQRDKVFDYLKEKYGENKIARIITFGKMASRAAVRDVGRALGYSFSFVDKLARLIPANMKLEEVKELSDIKKLIKENKAYEEILEVAQEIEGTVRHASVHACGTVIASEEITNFTPLQFAPQEEKVIITQYDMYSMSNLGLLKMDFLGLRTLSIIETAINLVKERHNIEINFNNQELNDPKTFETLKKGDTIGIFQLEGKGMTEYLKKLAPNSIEDISAMLALYRPGPLELIPSYTRRKSGKEEIVYLHPKLEPILKETYGIMVYQEQLMKIAQELAGYTPFEADSLRKAVGKKIQSLLEKNIKILVERMIKNGIQEEIAQKIGELIKPFARYGFNKSHSVAYAFLSYYTAYLKAHYPLEFLTACLTHEGKDIDRIKVYLKDIKEHNFQILPPDINESGFYFTIVGVDKIRFGLASIKNVGRPLVNATIEEREKNGKFKNLADFLKRVNHKDLDKKSLESLIKAGAFDSFYSREILIGNFEEILKYHQKIKNLSFQRSLFGGSSTGNLDFLLKNNKRNISFLDILKWEKELLGIYLSGHPCEKLKIDFNSKIKPIIEIKKMEEEHKIAFIGVINEVERRINKEKKPYAYLEVEDTTDKIEVLLFPDIYEKHFEILKEGNVYYFIGNTQRREKNNIIVLDVLTDITDKIK